MFSRRSAPLLVGILVLVGIVAYVTLYSSSPGELSRSHAAVAGSSLLRNCNKCHAEKDVTPGCLACHKEIQTQLQQQKGFHSYLLNGKKTTCTPCHSEHNGADFALINKMSWEGKDPRDFKHPHVAFRLSGAHTKLDCNACHLKPNSYLGKTQTCISCHQDPHAGGQAANCESCHDQNRWRPAPLFNHEKFFSLKGAHARVSCNQCHQVRSATANTPAHHIFGPVRGTRCIDCHGTPHHVDWRRACESCHKATEPWATARPKITRELHALTGFALRPPHQNVTCASCHPTGWPYAKRYPVPGRPAARCETCHKDPHAGQFVAKHPHCTDCHGQQVFKPARFTVAQHITYPLMGGHATATCNQCHVIDRTIRTRIFKGTSRACSSCHKDIHYGQFRMKNVTQCERCHTSTASWKQLSFDHNKQSQFPLDEAHAKVACKECHPMVSLANGAHTIQYKPVRKECRDCHDFDSR